MLYVLQDMSPRRASRPRSRPPGAPLCVAALADRRSCATLMEMEALFAMLLLPLLLVAPFGEALERRAERQRARDAARAWATTWLRLYGPAAGLTNFSTKRSAVPRLPACVAAPGAAFQSRASSGLRRKSPASAFTKPARRISASTTLSSTR